MSWHGKQKVTLGCGQAGRPNVKPADTVRGLRPLSGASGGVPERDDARGSKQAKGESQTARGVQTGPGGRRASLNCAAQWLEGRDGNGAGELLERGGQIGEWIEFVSPTQRAVHAAVDVNPGVERLEVAGRQRSALRESSRPAAAGSRTR